MKSILPQRSGYWKKNYTTYRRLWLDACLNAFSDEMTGLVIDLAGKREKKRGSFCPPEDQSHAWWYINIDRETSPNIYADVTCTPLQNGSVDCILCTEVLEHLPNPQSCVDEIHRLLREGGLVFASVPFFYPVHADPYDFQRFTEDGLRYLFRNFKSLEIYSMGGYPGVMGLMIELGVPNVEDRTISGRFMRWSMKWISRWLCWYDMTVFGNGKNQWNKFTTGYFVKASR